MVEPRPWRSSIDFEQVAALLRGQRRQAPVVEDQQLDTGEALEEAWIASIAARQRQCIEQAWHAIVEHRSIVSAGLLSECAGEPALACAGFAGDQKIMNRPCRLPLGLVQRLGSS